ncbi:hypothetical protein FRB94_014061 [Tulasnella sp. JGI-2019a]|nr:hypothetical protein FRB93_005266 [Tulasnella sp. JGI-2019a]KAG8989743.1 hypothetical protein FRB94_014061 [Tulasnella sp. JGI-2019a]KAG9023497.1 hypothetical protein FRB95_012996 [Tulasnella sp. JGI-2019a]
MSLSPLPVNSPRPNTRGRHYLAEESALGSVVDSIQHSVSSFARTQTFETGANLPSTPPPGEVFLDDEDDHFNDGDYDGDNDDHDHDNDSQAGWEEDGSRLFRAVGRGDEELLIGTGPARWDDGPSLNILGPSSTTTPSNARYNQRGGYALPLNPQNRAYRDRQARAYASRSRTSGPSSIASTPSRLSRLQSFSPPHERTPLVSSHRDMVSSNAIVSRPGLPTSPDVGFSSNVTITPVKPIITVSHAPPRRRKSSASKPHLQSGSSTFGQTLFNTIAILLGIGMLSCPLGFAYAGWVGGTLLMIFFGFLNCYTANILARIIVANPRLRTYADIGQAAFGLRANLATSILFCFELFAVSVILVVLFADSLYAVLPLYSTDTYKLIGLLVIIPSSFLPLRILSFASVLGILSTFTLIVVLLGDGIGHKTAPGSLWHGADTHLFPPTPHLTVPISFGLFMAGFSGHAVVPSIVRDMKDPRQYKAMINWAFFIATCVYVLIGAAGYRMFGNGVSEEISQDMLKIPGYNPFLNKLALWMLVLSPLTKFPLCIRPVCVTIEIWLGIEEPLGAVPAHNQAALPSSDELDDEDKGHLTQHNVVAIPTSEAEDGYSSSPPDDFFVLNNASTQQHQQRIAAANRRKAVFRMFTRALLTIFVVVVAICIPDFGIMMAFLGAFSAFTLCVIGPLAAKMSLERRIGFMDLIMLIVAVIMASWATYIAIVAAA